MTPISVAAILLSVALAGYVGLLIADSRHRKLDARVLAVVNRDADAARPTVATLTPRGERRKRVRFFDWVIQMLHFNPHVPALNVIPWRLVFMIGAVVGTAAVWAAGLWLNKTGTALGLAESVAVGVVVGLITIRSIFTIERDRYRRSLFRQLPDAVDLTVSSSMAGLPVSEAFRNIADGMRSPTREEFGIVVSDISLGASVENALMRLHDRTGVSEYAIFAMVISVQSQGGGRLTESLQHLAEMVRQRVAIGQRAYALAGEARMSATILIGLPFVAAALLSFIQPGYLDPLFADPRGVRLFMFAVISLILGFLTMRAMIQWATGQ